MDLKRIFKNNEKWIQEKLKLDKDYFKKLSQGQSPEILYIGCSDSRIPAEDMMGAKPGEVFVHRNIANQVITTDSNVNAVVQFAVETLKVKHIVICGHYECGGVKAALEPSDMGQLNNWLQKLRDVYRIHVEELNEIKDDLKKFDRLVELNVFEQAMNILKIDHVQKIWRKSGHPKIHGWVFDIRSGRIIDLNLDMETEYSKLQSIYNISK